MPLPQSSTPTAAATPEKTTVPSAGATFRAPDQRILGERGALAPGELDPSAAATTLGGDALRRQHLTLGDALDDQAGVKAQTLSGFGAPVWIRVRGSSAEQVAVTVDDVPLTSLDGAPLDLGELPLGQIERVELYRGMTPVLLGGQAIGGVLRIRLRQPRSIGGEATVGLGSYGARQLEAAGAWRGRQVRLSGGLRWLASDGDFPYRHDGGTAFDPSDDRTQPRVNNDLGRLGATVAGAWQASRRWQADARWFGSHLDQGVPGVALYEARSARFAVDRHLLLTSLAGRDVWQDGDHLRFSAVGSRADVTVSDQRGELGVPWHGSQVVTAGLLQVTYATPLTSWLGLEGRLGLDHGEVSGRDLLTASAHPRSTRTGLRSGLGLPVRLGNWELNPALTGEWQTSQRFTRQGHPFTWREVAADDDKLGTARLGAAWAARSWLQLSAAWTRGLRAPSLVELFGNDGIVLGNPVLRPEAAHTWEAGVTWTAGQPALRGALAVHGFTSQVLDLIQLQTLGPRQAIYGNVAAAGLSGLEVEARADLGPTLHLTAQHTTLVSEDRSGRAEYQGRRLPLRPRTRFGGRVDWQRALGPLECSASAELQWQSGHFLDAANLVVMMPRSTLGGGLRVAHAASQLFADLRLDNLLDAQRVDLIGYPLPARTAMFSIGWRSWDGSPPATATAHAAATTRMR